MTIHRLGGGRQPVPPCRLPQLPEQLLPLPPLAQAGDPARRRSTVAVLETGEVSGGTALHAAAFRGTAQECMLLLGAGQDPNARSNERITALMIAAWRGDQPVLLALLQHPAIDANASDADGVSVLHLAAERGNLAAVTTLLAVARNINPNAMTRDNNTPLHYAARAGDAGIVLQLVRSGVVDINARNRRHQTPLLLAADGGYTGVLRELMMAAGINAYASARDGLNALQLVVRSGSIDAVAAMLRHAELVELRTPERETVIHLAVRSANLATLQLLLQRRVAVAAEPNNQGYLPLHLVAERGHAHMVPDLARAVPGSINALTLQGETPLSVAVRRGHVAVVQALVEQPGINANLTSRSDRMSPLMQAARDGRADLAGVLRTVPGIDPDQGDGVGYTALFLAIRADSLATLQALTRLGGTNPNARTLFNQRTALHEAVLTDRIDLAGHLAGLPGIELAAEDINGDTALHMAASGATAGLVRLLIDAGIGDGINAQNHVGETALHVAVEHGRIDIVRLLIDHGIDIDVCDHDQFTALDVARANGNATVEAMLEAAASAAAQNENQPPNQYPNQPGF